MTTSNLAGRWERFWFSPTGPEALGLCRVLFFALMLTYFGGVDFGRFARVPSAFFMPIPLFEYLHLPVLSEANLRRLAAVWNVSLVLSCLGVMLRPSMVVSWVIGVYLIGLQHNFGKTNHSDAALILVMGILTLSRCGDAFALRRGNRWAWSRDAVPARRQAHSGEYRWPLRMVWVLTTMIFMAAGLAKLRQSGIYWVTSNFLATLLVNHHYSHEPPTRWGLFLARFPILTYPAALGIVVLELSFPLTLISAAARRVLVPAMFLSQVAFGLLMGVWFFHFLALYLVWVPWDKLLAAARVSRPSLVAFLPSRACRSRALAGRGN